MLESLNVFILKCGSFASRLCVGGFLPTQFGNFLFSISFPTDFSSVRLVLRENRVLDGHVISAGRLAAERCLDEILQL